jgi:hypothetical protein
MPQQYHQKDHLMADSWMAHNTADTVSLWQCHSNAMEE